MTHQEYKDITSKYFKHIRKGGSRASFLVNDEKEKMEALAILDEIRIKKANITKSHDENYINNQALHGKRGSDIRWGSKRSG